MMQCQEYTVESIEPIAVGGDVQARLFTLAPGGTIPWHFHSAVTDWYFVLEGVLSIETRAPAEHRELAIGEAYHIAPKNRAPDFQPLRGRYPFPAGAGCGRLRFSQGWRLVKLHEKDVSIPQPKCRVFRADGGSC